MKGRDDDTTFEAPRFRSLLLLSRPVRSSMRSRARSIAVYVPWLCASRLVHVYV